MSKEETGRIKPYIVIKGSHQNLAAFEEKVHTAFEDGYVPAGRLQIHPIQDGGKTQDLVLLQPFVLDIDDLDDEDEEDEDDYDE